MYLAIVKAITRYWGMNDREEGVYPLQCCAAAGADMEAQGQPWEPMAAVKAYAKIRQRDEIEVLLNMGALCRRHRMRSPFALMRFMAKQAERLEAEAASFAWGEGEGHEN